jgi:hypothetical protein
MANRARSSDLILAQTAICRLRPPLRENAAGVERRPRSQVPRAFTCGAAVEFEKKNELWKDPLLDAYARQIVQRSDRGIPPEKKYPWSVRIASDPNVNAYTYGGGIPRPDRRHRALARDAPGGFSSRVLQRAARRRTGSLPRARFN